jgi:hypothetical protein
VPGSEVAAETASVDTRQHRLWLRLLQAVGLHGPLLRRLPDPYRRGVAIIGIALVMGSTFALSYSLALGRPQPRSIAIGVVGPQQETASALGALQQGAAGGLVPSHFDSAAAALEALAQQRVYAVLQPGADRPTLTLSTASAASVARVLEQVTQRLPAGSAVSVVDAHPLPPSDPQGLTTFYVTIAATILGFVTVFQLKAHVGTVPLRGWFLLTGGLAVAAGAVLAVVSDPALGALSGPFFEIWGILTMQCAIAAMFNSLMLVLVGRWAILPTWFLFIVLGNSSSGGAVAAPLLPGIYAFLSRFLPTGATVSSLHTAVYFRSAQHVDPFLVLGAWLVITVGALLLACRRLQRTPTS